MWIVSAILLNLSLCHMDSACLVAASICVAAHAAAPRLIDQGPAG